MTESQRTIGRPPCVVAIGARYGKLTVIEQRGRNTKGQLLWVARCECGREVARTVGHLRRTGLASCGCAIREAQQASGAKRRIHGHYSGRFMNCGSPTYGSWQSMIARCHNQEHIAFRRYGAKAISVCKSWRDDFRNFLADMGERPTGTSLDRIDGRFGYFPSNCRWATQKQQTENRRRSCDRPSFMHHLLIQQSDPRVQEYNKWH